MAWKKVKVLNSLEKLPEVSCCYAIYFNDDLVYIGSTNNLRRRIYNYRFKELYGQIKTPWGRFDLDLRIDVKYKGSKIYGYWLMLEARLIKRLQPRFNVKLMSGVHNEMV